MAPPNVISQDTFDMVVLEYVVDFDKPLPEAIADAIEDFKLQKVLLTNIIHQVQLGPGGDTIVHPILEAVATIGKETANNATGGV